MRYLFISFFSLFCTPIYAITLTFAYEDKAQPPYYLGDTGDVPQLNPGVAVEMLQIMDSQLDEVEIKFVRMPWKRALYSLKSNRIDGIFNSAFLTERLEYGWYPTVNRKPYGPIDTSRRITQISYSLYKLASSPLDWHGDWSVLKEELVGAPLGFSIVTDLKKKGVRVEEFHSSQSNLRMLLTHRLKLVALQSVTADSLLETKKDNAEYAKIEKLTPNLISKPYYLMLSKYFVNQNPKLAQKIWDKIKQIRQEQRPALFARYQK